MSELMTVDRPLNLMPTKSLFVHTPHNQVQEPEAPTSIEEPVMQYDIEEEAAPPIVTSPDRDSMTVDQLKREQEEIARKIQDKQREEKRAIIEQIVDVVRTYNIPIDDLADALGFKSKRQGVKAQVKYRDPVTGTQWSGRGKEPAWIKGKDRKPFLIKN